MIRYVCGFCLTISFLMFALNSQATILWQQLAPGLEYTDVTPVGIIPWGHIHAFRIDLHYYRLDLALAADHDSRLSNAEKLATANNALIAVNGGFFTPKQRPIGLRIKNGKIRNPLKHTSWWGVFYISHNRPYISSQQRYRHKKRIQFAVQGGPRLIINKRIPTLKPGRDERTALGITANGKVIILATQNAPLSTTRLAEIMRRSGTVDGFNCVNALNLDGGSSTQMFANIGEFQLDISGYSGITDAVLVLARSQEHK